MLAGFAPGSKGKARATVARPSRAAAPPPTSSPCAPMGAVNEKEDITLPEAELLVQSRDRRTDAEALGHYRSPPSSTEVLIVGTGYAGLVVA